MASPLVLDFVMSGDSVTALPETQAEVAIVGRSNVGKSSLVNALCNRKKLAHVSNTPGRTRLLNLFRSEDGTAVMDLPGYGYAAASKTMRAEWQEMIERYLLERESLVMIVVLVDGAVGPTKLDLQMLAWLRACELPHSVVATKHDKVKSSKRQVRKRDVAQGCGLEEADVVWVSSAKGTGIKQLRQLLYLWCSPG